MHFIPGLRLRCDEETEILGVDDAEMGEFAYDYVGIEAELGHSARPGAEHMFSDNIPAGGVGATGGGREPNHHQHLEKEKGSEEGSVGAA
jgi:ammonium transporter, Amt family